MWYMVQVENEQRAQLPSRQGASPEQTSNLEESIYKLSAQLSTISRNQKYFRTRENRNFSTVRSTERRIFNFSVIESLMMVSMAGLQVFVVRFFFQGARKGMFGTRIRVELVGLDMKRNHVPALCLDKLANPSSRLRVMSMTGNTMHIYSIWRSSWRIVLCTLIRCYRLELFSQLDKSGSTLEMRTLALWPTIADVLIHRQRHATRR